MRTQLVLSFWNKQEEHISSQFGGVLQVMVLRENDYIFEPWRNKPLERSQRTERGTVMFIWE